MKNKKIFDVAIVGAGASGMVAAIEAAKKGLNVVILEHLDKCGKKLLATGNGKCNYTNTSLTKEYYHTNNIPFVENIIQNYPTDFIINYLKELGIYPKENKGYIYPYSQTAQAVCDALFFELRRLEVKIICNFHVESIKFNDSFELTNKNTNEIILARNVILASGGKSGQGLGSDGSGFEFAKAFGHSIKKAVPALVSLKADCKYLKTIQGVRLEGKASLIIDNKLIEKQSGELVFTSYGISGIPIMQLSRIASYALIDKQKVTVELDFFPDYDKKKLKEMINYRFENRFDKTNEEVLNGLLNKKLIFVFLKMLNINPEGYDNISYSTIDRLISYFKAFKLNIIDNNGFEFSQVTAGGIDTCEINERTMESKLKKGLYFCGEIIDVDGLCGGYNLHFAFTSGIIAGRNIE